VSTKSHIYCDGWCLEIYDETSDERGSMFERPVRIAASEVDDIYVSKVDDKYEIEFSLPAKAIIELAREFEKQVPSWWKDGPSETPQGG